MSAVRSLTGGKRTWRGQPISVANDPKLTNAFIAIRVYQLASNDL